jgi:hypothetical protein
MNDGRIEYGARVGEITVRCISDDVNIKPCDFWDDFLTEVSDPDIDIRAHDGLPDIKPEELVFDSKGLWKLYRWQGKHLFVFTAPNPTPHVYKIGVFTQDFTRGDVYVKYHYPHETIDPIEYPLDELLWVNYLALGRGLEVHGLGIIANETGLAFIGVSGSGKSTLAELWKKRDVRILSDDRLILRRKDGGIQMYGTPWHGDARISLAEDIPLHSIYFLKQARENRIVRLSPIEAASRLLVRCFPTFYYLKGMEYTLNFISEVVQEIPCFELQFKPDQQAIDEVLNNLERVSG